MCEQGGQGERQLVCIPLPSCPSSFCPKISSLTSVSILLRAGESWQERVALSSVAPIFPVTLYPSHPVRCPESSLGAHCTECGAVHKFLAIALVFLPLLLHIPLFFHPGTESWCQPHWSLWQGELVAAASINLQSPAQNCAQLSCLFEAQERVKLLNYKYRW